MTQKEKRLLLIDLCARLPYGVIVHIHDNDVDDYDRQLIGEDLDFIELDRRNCKPYLRPMSSMTEKERDDLEDWSHGWFYVNEDGEIFPMGQFTGYGEFEDGILVGIEYLIKNHFDYRGLIEMGLALEAPDGIYKTE